MGIIQLLLSLVALQLATGSGGSTFSSYALASVPLPYRAILGLDAAAIKRLSSQPSQPYTQQVKAPESVLFRTCTGINPNDCDDINSGNGDCVDLSETPLTEGSFLALYPSKRCYTYPKANCKGTGGINYEGNWLVATQELIVSSYKCFT